MLAAETLPAFKRMESNESTGHAPPGNSQQNVSASHDERYGDRMVQNLIDSFAKRDHKPDEKPLNTSAPGYFSSVREFASDWKSHKWIALTAAVAALLVLGVVAYRSPARNVGINVSKVGQLPSADVKSGTPSSGGNHDSDPNGNAPPPVIPLRAPPSSASPTGQALCLNLGAASDKIRIYLWAERDTPRLSSRATRNT